MKSLTLLYCALVTLAVIVLSARDPSGTECFVAETAIRTATRTNAPIDHTDIDTIISEHRKLRAHHRVTSISLHLLLLISLALLAGWQYGQRSLGRRQGTVEAEESGAQAQGHL